MVRCPITSDITPIRPNTPPSKKMAHRNCPPCAIIIQSGSGMDPNPMQLVVVRAVTNAVSAATITFTATSMMRFLSMSFKVVLGQRGS